MSAATSGLKSFGHDLIHGGGIESRSGGRDKEYEPRDDDNQRVTVAQCEVGGNVVAHAPGGRRNDALSK